jgi:hypothetical protein
VRVSLSANYQLVLKRRVEVAFAWGDDSQSLIKSTVTSGGIQPTRRVRYTADRSLGRALACRDMIQMACRTGLSADLHLPATEMACNPELRSVGLSKRTPVFSCLSTSNNQVLYVCTIYGFDR